MKEERKNVRNLLVIGRTGCGKSALANLLSDTYEFEESGGSVSKTENFKKTDFEWNGTKYCVADTVGVGNIKLTKKEFLHKMTEGINSIPEGISRVLFVIDREFTPEEIKMLKSFEDDILKSGIAKYTTIVRTRFVNFNNINECETNKNQLHDESKTIAKIVKLCSIVFVDNPSINILAGDDDADDVEIMIRINKKKKAKSRTILLDHLENKCQGKPYNLTKWDVLRTKAAKLFKK